MLFFSRCKMFTRERSLRASLQYSRTNFNHFQHIKRGFYFQKNGHNKNSELATAQMSDTYTWKNSNHWNKVWEDNQYFSSKESTGKETFRMILPPPNVTGVLHLGHALTCTIQDVLARWRRMRGDSVIWVPGLDHAGIATQVVVEKYLSRTKGVDRYDLGKEDFLLSMKKWKEEKGDVIRSQLRDLGASLDWSREFFTMSKEHSRAVTEAFVALSERDLLYRNEALINWSTSLRSAISDMEIEHVPVTKRTDMNVPGYEKKVPFGLLARVALNLRDSKEQLVIATTRVETMPGDVAVAVHPDDPRYAGYVGREVWHPVRKTFVPIIPDTSVERDFGTGVVKITPAHDRNDLAVAKRHDLPIIQVIGNDGKITGNAGSFQGLPRFVAREKVLEELAKQGALLGLENHEMLVPVCSRSGDVVEYLLREQWFLRTKEMAERAVRAVRDGSLKIDPPEWIELWCDWLSNNRDWGVSRQIWWGHRIPAYRFRDGKDWVIARSEEEARRSLPRSSTHESIDAAIEQDPDVLDTWFSSALLPLSAMGWPDRKFEKFNPLSLMETGHDIIFLWVARMVMLGTELTGTLPFKEALLHGVLCDAQGKKMSKSRGNVIRPEHIVNGISLEELNVEAAKSFDNGILSKEELKRTLAVNRKMFPDGIPECGIDALRLTLCAHNIKGSRISFNVIECRTNKHFCNKIWQATRYVLRMIDESGGTATKPEKLSMVDRWILSRLSLMVEKVNEAFETRNFYRAILAIKQFFYYEFCDYYVEATKPAFRNGDCATAKGHAYGLAKSLEVSLRILAPITPYLSEDLYIRCAKNMPEIFSSLPSLVEAPYPTFSGDLQSSRDPELEKKFDRLLDVVGAIRNVLAQVIKKSDVEVHVVTEVPEGTDYFAENVNFLATVTRVRNFRVLPSREYAMRKNSILCNEVTPECRVYVILADEADVTQVKNKMQKKRELSAKKLEKLLRRTKLSKMATSSESEISSDQEEIKNLEAELKRYPKLS